MLERKKEFTDYNIGEQAESIKVLDQKETLDEQNYDIITEIIEKQTGIPFDDNDLEWNKFVIKHTHITTMVINSYNSPFLTVSISIMMLYGVLSYCLSFSNFFQNTIFATLFTTKAFLLLSYYCIFYLPLYVVTVSYILPYLFTYYSLRKEISLKHILYKSIQLINGHNMIVFIGVLLVILDALFFSTPQEFLQYVKQKGII